jgi:hypothetical protein
MHMSNSHVEPILDSAGDEWIQAEVLFVPVDNALNVLRDLHLRSTGGRDGLSAAVLDLSPIEAFNHYEESTAALLAQISISDASFARDLIDSVDAFGRNKQSIEGLEGVLATSALKIDTDDVAGSIDKAASLIRDLGISPSLGGGRGATHTVDAVHKVTADLGPQALQNFADQAVGAGLEALREGLGVPAGDGGGAGGAGLEIFAGLFTLAVGALVSAFVPPVGAALEATGAALLSHGISELQHPHQPHQGGGHPPAGGEAAHGAPFKITETHYEKTTTHPDGSVTTEKFSTHTTEGIAVQAHPKGAPHGGEDKIWDDAGGTDESGRPIPINPLAVLMCPVDEPQPGEEGKIPLDIMPLLGPLGEMRDSGGLTFYDSFVSSEAVQLETVVYDFVDDGGVAATRRGTITWKTDQGLNRTAGQLEVVVRRGEADLIVTVPGSQLAQPDASGVMVRRSSGAGEGTLIAVEELPPVERAIVSGAADELQALIARVTSRTVH